MFEGWFFVVFVEVFGMIGEVDRVMEMVEDMESWGVFECVGVYYVFVFVFCIVGWLSEVFV